MNYICKKEVAKRLSVSLATVDRMLASGRLPFVKLGTTKKCAVRIPESAIAKLGAA